MAGQKKNVDWQALVFGPEYDLMAKLEAISERNFGRTPDAGAAFSYALDAVSDDDWKRLRDGYKGIGSPAGFLTASFVNLMEDYRRKKQGKKTHPLWIKRLGPLWTRIHQMLCWQRLLPETIVDALGARAEHSRSEIRSAIVQIKAKDPNCGEFKGEFPEDAAGTFSETPGHEPGAILDFAEQRKILEALAATLANAEDLASASNAHVSEPVLSSNHSDQALQQASAGLKLGNKDRLLLKLVYDEGHSVSSAARALRMDRKSASRRHIALKRKLKSVLEPLGLKEPEAE